MHAGTMCDKRYYFGKGRAQALVLACCEMKNDSQRTSLEISLSSSESSILKHSHRTSPHVAARLRYSMNEIASSGEVNFGACGCVCMCVRVRVHVHLRVRIYGLGYSEAAQVKYRNARARITIYLSNRT